jgi:hypothetical protein
MEDELVSHSQQNVSYRFEWELPLGVKPELLPIIHEFVRRGRRNEDLGDNHEVVRRLWTLVNYLLGVPAAVLAGISGGVGLGDYRQLAAVLAFVSAGLGGLLAFLNPAARISQAGRHAAAHWRIAQWARYVLTAELGTADASAAKEYLREIQERENTALELT